MAVMKGIHARPEILSCQSTLQIFHVSKSAWKRRRATQVSPPDTACWNKSSLSCKYSIFSWLNARTILISSRSFTFWTMLPQRLPLWIIFIASGNPVFRPVISFPLLKVPRPSLSCNRYRPNFALPVPRCCCNYALWSCRRRGQRQSSRAQTLW